MKKRRQKRCQLEHLQFSLEVKIRPNFYEEVLNKEPTDLLWRVLYNLKKHIKYNKRMHDDGND